jgi:1-acyl-sn-glycerol-3-phosphate acyltransferase
LRAGVPIIPCAVVGTHTLLKVEPWLPFRRGTLWLAYGEPIVPPAVRSTRQTRLELAESLRREFQRLYAGMQERYAIDDRNVP